jgi:hypothetical protein
MNGGFHMQGECNLNIDAMESFDIFEPTDVVNFQTPVT